MAKIAGTSLLSYNFLLHARIMLHCTFISLHFHVQLVLALTLFLDDPVHLLLSFFSRAEECRLSLPGSGSGSGWS
jgi:hypothetical protein